MKRTAISLMLAFSTMTGLVACGPEQMDPSEAPATGESTAALSCEMIGYYYCANEPQPVTRYEFVAATCVEFPEQAANFARADCVAACGKDCIRVNY